MDIDCYGADFIVQDLEPLPLPKGFVGETQLPGLDQEQADGAGAMDGQSSYPGVDAPETALPAMRVATVGA